MFWDEKIHYVAVLYALAGNQTARFCSVRRTARIGRNDEKAARAGWKLSAEAHQKRGGICEDDKRQGDTALCIIRLWIVGQPENVVG